MRVLFIEDDPAVAQMYQLKLQLDGYQVTIARDGEAGLRMAREDPPAARRAWFNPMKNRNMPAAATIPKTSGGLRVRDGI